MAAVPPPDNVDGPSPTTTSGQTATATTTSTQGEFGDSEFGDRLAYTKSQYRDLWAFILFYVHVVVIIVVAIYGWAVAIPEAAEEAAAASTTSTTTTEEPMENDANPAGVLITLVVSLVAGILFGLLWLQCMKMFAEYIIKILLFVQIACWVVVIILGIAIGAIVLAIIGGIFLAITCLYTWCIWHRIPFAAACLWCASLIVQKYPGVIYTAVLTVFLEFIWILIWIFAYVAYLLGETDNNIVTFLLFISLYWGVNVWRNVSHTTTCGVAATWYFTSGTLASPAKGAFKRTCTTSFGSICFGSLLVAILQAIRAMLRGSKNGLVMCLLHCIERIMRYFNKYAFAQVAIYGTTFWQSAQRTWDLFMNNGLKALINDDLSGLALTCGALLGLVVCGIVSYFVGLAFYPNGEAELIACVVVGAVLGYYAVVIILLCVASGVVAIFVCFAEDPAACATNRPEAYERLTGVSPVMQEIAQNRGVGGGGGQQMA